MAKRKPWSQLTPTYRARLEKAGLTEEQFDSGASIKAARGHATTPERPTQYNPVQFPAYAANRQQLIIQLGDRKEQVFGSSPRWDRSRSDHWIRIKPPSIAQLRWAVNVASDEDLYSAIREDPKTFTFLGYG